MALILLSVSRRPPVEAGAVRQLFSFGGVGGPWVAECVLERTAPRTVTKDTPVSLGGGWRINKNGLLMVLS